MYREHCYNASPSYQESIQSLSLDPNRIVQQDRIIQFPFTSSVRILPSPLSFPPPAPAPLANKETSGVY